MTHFNIEPFWFIQIYKITQYFHLPFLLFYFSLGEFYSHICTSSSLQLLLLTMHIILLYSCAQYKLVCNEASTLITNFWLMRLGCSKALSLHQDQHLR